MFFFFREDLLLEVVCTVRAEVIAQFGRLVVGNVLRGYRESVGNVLHQAVDAIGCGNGGDVET